MSEPSARPSPPLLPTRDGGAGGAQEARGGSRRTTVWSRPVKGSVALLVVLLVTLAALWVPAIFGSRILHAVAGDMQPVVETGEYLYVNVHAYGDGTVPARGDLVTFRTYDVPAIETRNGENAMFLKRVVALPGETIAIVGGKLKVNGAVPPELEGLSYVIFDVPGGGLTHEGATFTVPQDAVYVLGDHSKNSYDSRFWGPVPLKALRGRAEGCVWPLARARWY